MTLYLLPGLYLLASVFGCARPDGATAAEWQAQGWMNGESVTVEAPVLSITDLPPLDPFPPSADALLEARARATDAGAKGAVLSFGWSALERAEGEYTFGELREAVEWNTGRELLLGIQLINMSAREFPPDLAGLPIDDPRIARRLHMLLDALAPLLRKRVAYLSLGNEVDWYLALHADEWEGLTSLLAKARKHAKKLAPGLLCGTTVTEGATKLDRYASLVGNADVHFVNYYGGTEGSQLAVHKPQDTYRRLGELLQRLDERPLVLQELGYPASSLLGSSDDDQAHFVREAMRFWRDHQDRIPFANWFLLYDFPESFAAMQADQLGVGAQDESFLGFLTSLGLHRIDGTERPAWEALKRSSPIHWAQGSTPPIEAGK